MSKTGYQMGLVVSSYAVHEPRGVTYNFEPKVQERKGDMDAFAKHIHGNEAFSLENVAKAIDAAIAAKRTRQR